MRTILPSSASLLLLAVSTFSLTAQELEPRRWAHLPTGFQVAGAGFAYTEADIVFNPVLELENVEMELNTYAFKYVATFPLLGKSARIDLSQAYQQGRWEGVLQGEPASTERDGWTDSVVRFSMLLKGGPPIKGASYAEYRSKQVNETIVGAGLAIHLPTGEYLEDRLINLGHNRFLFRPQIGILHQRSRWSYELSAASWLYTDNNDFYGGNELKNSPMFTLQGHLVYTIRPGLWIAGGAGFGYGAESELNGVEKHDEKENLAYGGSVGWSLAKRVTCKIGYLGTQTQADTGADSHTAVFGLSSHW